MEHRILGKTGLSVSVLGFGGAEIGFEDASTDTVERLLGAALDAGLNVIDTAECYNTSEELIGRAVSGRRSHYHLFSKCGHASGFDLPDWNPEMLMQSIERSLQRLQTGHLDVLQLHSCDEETLRRGDVIEVVQRARDEGKTRFIGFSGDGAAARYAVECGVFDTLQLSLSVLDQEAIDALLPAAAAREMGVIAKRPIGNAAWQHATLPDNSYHQDYWKRAQDLKFDFLQGDAPNGIATALRWTLGAPGVHTAIVGTTKPDRWQENADLLKNGALPQPEWDAIRARWTEVAAPDWTARS